MSKVKPIVFFLCCFSLFCNGQVSSRPSDFINVKKLIPTLKVELRYFGNNNFVGDTINGYYSNTLFLTKPTAIQLNRIQQELSKQGLGLLVYDGYRPQRAVNNFVIWARQLEDTINKGIFYPNVRKQDLFKEGYIASKSGHSRGSTIDLTIVDLESDKPLDMGSAYDFFGPESWVNYQNITTEQKENRALLQKIMSKYGFRNYPKEWWHFTLRNEPFPDTYFDFPID